MCSEKVKSYVVDRTLEFSPEFVRAKASVIPVLFQVSLLGEVDVRVEKISEYLLSFVDLITPYDVALVYLWNPQYTWFCRGLQGEMPKDIEKGNIFTQAIRDTGKPVLVPDLTKTDLEGEDIPLIFTSMIGLPIYKDTKIIGCIELYRRGGANYDINDLILSKHLLLSAEKIIQEVSGAEKEIDDALDIRIDIPQKHVLLDILHQYEEMSKRMSYPLSVAIVAIQDLEKIGIYSHLPEGVRMLKTLAKRIKDGLRCYDKVLRYEEHSFFVILPGCGAQEATTALNNATMNLGADLADNMKIGIATMPDEAQDANSLVNIAHQALSYARKKDSRMTHYSQTGSIKSTNLSLELSMMRVLPCGPSVKALNDLLDLIRIQCQADDISLRNESPGTLVNWEGYDLGYISHKGLSRDIYDWIITYICPAWAVSLGIDADISNWYLGILTTASILSDLRAGYPMGYSIKVADQMYTLAKEMGMGEIQATQWANSSLVANVGYLGIPSSIFTKGDMTPFDKKKLYNHTIISNRMMKGFAVLDLDNDLLLYHHEHLDGSGYPRGLKGEEIPVGARALRVVDTFNAMTSPRLHRLQLDRKDALKELCAMSGKVLDPDITSLYVDIIGF